MLKEHFAKEQEKIKIDKHVEECSCINAHNICVNNFYDEEIKAINLENFKNKDLKNDFVKERQDYNKIWNEHEKCYAQVNVLREMEIKKRRKK